MLLNLVKLHAYLSSFVALNDTFRTEENITSETLKYSEEIARFYSWM